MATGACGINCDTCRLHRLGNCSSCGSGRSELAVMKIETQKRLLGSPCSILACAVDNQIDYCMADCDSFPCANFTESSYPYGHGFLAMQTRRREAVDSQQLAQRNVLIPPQHWQKLKSKDPIALQQATGAVINASGLWELKVLNQLLQIDLEQEKVEQLFSGLSLPIFHLLAFVTVVYMATAEAGEIEGKWMSEKDLTSINFFRGIHKLPVDNLYERFGNDPQGFITAAEKLGGIATNDPGDAAVRLWVFPQIPIKICLWQRDDEFPAEVSILFDSSIKKYLPADGIYSMVRLLSDTLVEVSEE